MVPCPEWGGDVAVYPLTCEQVEQMESWNDANPSGVGYRVKLLSMALGGEWSIDELAKLNRKQAGVIKRLATVAADLCKPDPVELAKNSEAVESGGNGSGSASHMEPPSVDLSNFSPELSSTS